MKGFKIVTGTALEVSAEVTRLQGDGWLLRGELLTYAHIDPAVDNMGRFTQRFAQVVVLKEDQDAPIER